MGETSAVHGVASGAVLPLQVLPVAAAADATALAGAAISPILQTAPSAMLSHLVRRFVIEGPTSLWVGSKRPNRREHADRTEGIGSALACRTTIASVSMYVTKTTQRGQDLSESIARWA